MRLTLILVLSCQGNISLMHVTNFKAQEGGEKKRSELLLTEFPMHINETRKFSTRWCCRNLLESSETLILKRNPHKQAQKLAADK